MSTQAEAAGAVLQEAVVLLGAGLGAVLLFRRFGLGAVLGYLVAGAAVGPHGLGLVGGAEDKLHLADYGIVLLLFLVGLELHPTRLWRLRREIFGLGLVQVLACGVALSAFVYLATTTSWAAAFALGLPLALSSTAQVLPSLTSSGRIHTPFGERAFSILLFQDLSIVPLLTVVAALSRAPADPSAPPGWLLGIYTVLAIAGLVVAGRYLLNPLLRLIGRLGERELFVAVGLFAVLAAAALMQWLGLSTALGAFVAGVMLADSPYRHELEADVEPFRAVLLGLFFLAVGMMLDLGMIAQRPLFVIGMAAALVAIKAGIITGLARLWGFTTRRAFALGLLLSQGGEFGFVLFAEAQNAFLITGEAASLFGAVVTLSMATTPFLMMLRDRLVRKDASSTPKHEGPEHSPATGAIVVGCGRFGQTVSQMLFASRVSVTLIDKKPAQIELSAEFGTKIYYGDGTRIDLLRQAGAADAGLILFCTDVALTPAELRPVLDSFPNAKVFVRAFDRRNAMALASLELAGVTRELFESAVAMGRGALVAAGVDEARAREVETEYRRRDELRLEEQARSGDMHALAHMIFRPEAPARAETAEERR